MYTTFLFLHSWLRWIVLILAIIVIYRSYIGQKGSFSFSKQDNILALSFVSVVHLTTLIGLVLYFFLSPITSNAWGAEDSPMTIAGVRYWAVEHIFAMLLAVISITIGRAKSKKQEESVDKFRVQLIWFAIGFGFIISRIPWTDTIRLFRF